jgi:hypothetical protein
MAHLHGRVDFVAALAAWTPATACSNFQIGISQLDLFRSGDLQHGNGDGAGLDSAAAFVGRNSLPAMSAGFIVKQRKAFAFNAENCEPRPNVKNSESEPFKPTCSKLSIRSFDAALRRQAQRGAMGPFPDPTFSSGVAAPSPCRDALPSPYSGHLSRSQHSVETDEHPQTCPMKNQLDPPTGGPS